MKLKNNIFTKSIFLLMAIFLFIMSPIEAYAHNAYFLSVTYDTKSHRYVGEITKEIVGDKGKNHAELQISSKFYLLEAYQMEAHQDDELDLPYINYARFDEDDIEDWEDFDTTKFDNEDPFLFTFPSHHTKGWVRGTDQMNCDGVDLDLAERVSIYVIDDLNACIGWILSRTGFEKNEINVRNLACLLADECDYWEVIKEDEDDDDYEIESRHTSTIYYEPDIILEAVMKKLVFP